MAEQAPFGGLAEPGPGRQLRRAADVVEECRGEQQIGPEPRVELAELPADRGDADRVLEQAARVVVVPVRCGGQGAHPSRVISVSPRIAVTVAAQPGVRDLAGEELDESRPARPGRGAWPGPCRPGRLSGAASIERTSSWSRSR